MNQRFKRKVEFKGSPLNQLNQCKIYLINWINVRIIFDQADQVDQEHTIVCFRTGSNWFHATLLCKAQTVLLFHSRLRDTGSPSDWQQTRRSRVTRLPFQTPCKIAKYICMLTQPVTTTAASLQRRYGNKISVHTAGSFKYALISTVFKPALSIAK